MRIIYIKAKNIKSIPNDCEVLNFCENGNFEEDKVFPTSTMILGGNGVSKSTFLEGIALLSHVNVMGLCKDNDPRSVEEPSYFEVKICLTFDKNTIETPKDKEDTGSKKERDKKDRDLRNGAKDFITFVFAAREDENSNKFSHEIASLLSSHIVDQDKIKKHWCVYYPYKEEEKDRINKYLETLTYNRPPHPISNSINTIEELNKLSELNRQTGRAKKLFELDDTNGLYEELAKNGTVVFINTDLNDFGLGLNIFESPKNIKSDLPSVIHHRLPCTLKDGSLRDLKKLSSYWRKIFKYSENKNTILSNKEKRGREIKNVQCKEGDDGKIYAIFEIENNYGEIKSIETLSSGENEIFFVLSTIISLKLHNSVLLLDEPELHLSLEKLHLYYDAIFHLAYEFDLQLIIVTQMPFILGYLTNGDVDFYSGEAPPKGIIRTELRLLKAEGKENEQATKLAIKEDKIEIGTYIFENNIFRYCADSYLLLQKAKEESEKSNQ